MSDITVDQKLKLVNQIRQEQLQNSMAMKNRERLLYGEHVSGFSTAAPPPTSYYNNTVDSIENISTMPKEMSGLKSTLGIRFMVALLLFLGYLGMWKANTSIGSLTPTVILEEVNRYSEINSNLFDFMNNFTYTLNTD